MSEQKDGAIEWTDPDGTWLTLIKSNDRTGSLLMGQATADDLTQALLANPELRMRVAAGIPEVVYDRDQLRAKPTRVLPTVSAGGSPASGGGELLLARSENARLAQELKTAQREGCRMHYLGNLIRQRDSAEQAELNALMRKYPPNVVAATVSDTTTGISSAWKALASANGHAYFDAHRELDAAQAECGRLAQELAELRQGLLLVEPEVEPWPVAPQQSPSSPTPSLIEHQADTTAQRATGYCVNCGAFVCTCEQVPVETAAWVPHPDVGAHPVTDVDAEMLINGHRRGFVDKVQYYLNELLDNDAPLHVIGHIESECADYEKLIRDAVKVYGNGWKRLPPNAKAEPAPPPSEPERPLTVERLVAALRCVAAEISKPGARNAVPGYVMQDTLAALADALKGAG